MRAVLAFGKSGQPGLALFDETGDRRIIIGLPTGYPMLTMFGPNDEKRVMLTAAGDGSPELTLFDSSGTPHVGIHVLPDGSASIIVRSSGYGGIELHASSQGTPSAVVRDQGGSVIWRTPT